MNVGKKCPNCGEEVIGREGKKFCSPYCKSNYHYEKSKQKESSLFKKIDTQLKRNRRILKNYNKAGKSTVRREVLHKEGFDPKYFTHGWRAENKNLYMFCYEYGFMKASEKGKGKYVLVTWQPYMDE